MNEIERLFKAAVARHRAGDLSGAVAGYRAVLARAPGLQIAEDNLCLALLAAGDYAQGFALYDTRFLRREGRVERPRLSFPPWSGEPLAGRSILVAPEQGYGDQIMFARFVASLAERGALVTLIAPPLLARLFAALPAVVLEHTGATPVPQHDYWVMMGSLPGRLGVGLGTLPSAPYLPSREGGQGVGVAWRGDRRHHNDADRSLPAELAAELLGLPGAVSLDPQDTGAADFADTARIVAGLAAVVSVDTAVAHLAGAMGKPVSVLLPARNTDWRWLRDRQDSPWYPSATLLRQTTPGDWRGVLDRVRAVFGGR